MKNLAIFASGTGSNAKKIIEYFSNHSNINVQLIVSNKKEAPVLDIARENGIATLIVQRTTFYETQDLLKQLHAYNIDFIVLAGFLWLLPAYLVQAYPRRIVNIHPALLPKYGGKGMYGKYVHEAVKAAGERASGITIHFVNENYDEGDIIFQQSCDLSAEDTSEEIARKVQKLEHEFFPKVIEQLLTTY